MQNVSRGSVVRELARADRRGTRRGTPKGSALTRLAGSHLSQENVSRETSSKIRKMKLWWSRKGATEKIFYENFFWERAFYPCVAWEVYNRGSPPQQHIAVEGAKNKKTLGDILLD